MRAVIFDLDGVIVSTDRYHYEAWAWLAEQWHWKFDVALNDRLRGVSRMASLQAILDYNQIDLPDHEKMELAERKNTHYRALLAKIDASALVPGAVDFVNAVRNAGLKTGIGSGSRNAGLVLDRLDITALFDTVVTGHDIQRSKPDPETFLLAAKRLEVLPSECIVFEDAASGVEAANTGGMFSVGFGTTTGLDDAGLLVPSYSEITVERLLTACNPK